MHSMRIGTLAALAALTTACFEDPVYGPDGTTIGDGDDSDDGDDDESDDDESDDDESDDDMGTPDMGGDCYLETFEAGQGDWSTPSGKSWVLTEWTTASGNYSLTTGDVSLGEVSSVSLPVTLPDGGTLDIWMWFSLAPNENAYIYAGDEMLGQYGDTWSWTHYYLPLPPGNYDLEIRYECESDEGGPPYHRLWIDDASICPS